MGRASAQEELEATASERGRRATGYWAEVSVEREETSARPGDSG